MSDVTRILDHPNIAKVFDAGATETGRPYFVMELVRGITLTGKGQLYNRGVRFSSDGNWLAACSLAGQLNIWHAPSWQKIAAAEAKDNVEARQP